MKHELGDVVIVSHGNGICYGVITATMASLVAGEEVGQYTVEITDKSAGTPFLLSYIKEEDVESVKYMSDFRPFVESKGGYEEAKATSSRMLTKPALVPVALQEPKDPNKEIPV